MDEPQTHLASRLVADDRLLYEVIYAVLTILILQTVHEFTLRLAV